MTFVKLIITEVHKVLAAVCPCQFHKEEERAIHQLTLPPSSFSYLEAKIREKGHTPNERFQSHHLTRSRDIIHSRPWHNLQVKKERKTDIGGREWERKTKRKALR